MQRESQLLATAKVLLQPQRCLIFLLGACALILRRFKSTLRLFYKEKKIHVPMGVFFSYDI